MKGEDTLLSVTTERATYVLHPGSHHTPTELSKDTLQQIDAVVLEGGVRRYEQVTLAALKQDTQYAELVDAVTAQQKPVFLVDVPYRSAGAKTVMAETGLLGAPFLFGLYGLLHGHPGFSGLLLPAIAACTGGSAAGQRANTAASYLQLSGAYTSRGFRSAVAAAKLEQSVVPRLTEQVDGKPRILVEYGAGHLDIAAYLRHPALRRHVITAGKRLHRRTVKTEDYRQVCTFERTDTVYEKTVYKHP